jgi:hypothetical protein
MRKRKDLETGDSEPNADSNSNDFLLNDENYKLNYLKTLYGYLNLIENGDLKEFFLLNDLKNLDYLLDALISCILFDYNSLDNFFSIENNPMSVTTKHSKTVEFVSNYDGLKTFLSNKTIYKQLGLICSYLGKSNLIRLIIDQLLFNKLSYNNEQNEILFIVNLLLSDINKSEYLNEEEVFAILNLILTNFLSDSSSKSDDFSESRNFISDANRAITNTCLKIEVIRISSVICASSTNNTRFQNRFLIDTLFFLLENFLNKNLLIKAVCNKCMSDLALNLKFASIQDLLAKNFDYIMNDLILKINNTFKSLQSDAGATNSNILILCSLIDISSKEIVFYLNRLIEDLFFACDMTPSNFSLLNGVCSIMLRMAKSMQKWHRVSFESLFVDESAIDSDKEEFDFSMIDFKKLANSRKTQEYTRPFLDVLNEIDANRIQINEEFFKQQTENEE